MELAQVDLLQRMPVFGGLREPALRRLLERATPVHRASGEAFFLEGDAAEAMYVLKSGRVAVTKRWQSSEFVLHLHETDVEQFALMQMNLGRELCRRLRATDERLSRAAMGEALSAPAPLGDGAR